MIRQNKHQSVIKKKKSSQFYFDISEGQNKMYIVYLRGEYISRCQPTQIQHIKYEAHRRKEKEPWYCEGIGL